MSALDRTLKAGSGAVLGATVALFAVAALDCSYSRGGQFFARWLADLGLLAPLALLLGLCAAGARLFFHGGTAPSPRRVFAAWRALDGADRARHNASFLIVPLAFVAWLTVTANLATRLLGSDVPARAAGASLALSGLATFWVGIQLVAGASEAIMKLRPVARLEPVLAAYLRWHELRRAVDTRRGDERASQPGDTPPEDAAAWFDVGTHESGEPSRRVIVALEDTPSDEILRIGHWYTLAVAVDVAQGVAAVASPSVADIDEVAVTVQLDSGDFRIESPIGTLHVPRTGRSRRKARFEISPLHDGPSTLTATLHKDGNYLQNVVVTFVVGGDRAVPMETTTLGRSSSAASVLKPRDIGISLSLTADGYDCIVWGEVAARARLPLQPAYLASAIDALRRELLKVVRYRDADGRSVFQERIDIPASDRDFALRTMARAGALLFQRMFFGPAAGPDAKSVGNYLREAASDPARHLRLQVVAETAPIPWGLLYVGDASAGAKLDWNLFIGMRHIVDEIPLQTTLAVADSTIASEPRLAVSVSVNTGMDAQLGLTVVADQQAYWANAARKRARVGVTSRLTRADVLAALANSATDDQILYFYCQAESGGLSHLGGPDASALVLSDAKLTLGDLVLHAPTSTPLAGKPLVFINACESTELSPAFYDGFVPYFMAKGARGLIGTQVSTPALFAAAWAERFFDRFLAGEAVGDAFLALRREFLEQHGNPLGLLYAVHCDGDIRIEPALQ